MFDRTLVAVDHGLRWLELALAAVAAVFIFGLMFFAVAEIFGRRFLGAPISGYMDIVVLTMVAYGVLAISYCQRVGGHVRMDLLIGSLTGRPRYLMEFVATALAWVVVSLLIRPVFAHAERAYTLGDSTMDIALPTWPSKLAIGIALALLWGRLLIELIGYARLILRPDATPLAVPEEPRIETDDTTPARP